jgi:hypothetical protein
MKKLLIQNNWLGTMSFNKIQVTLKKLLNKISPERKILWFCFLLLFNVGHFVILQTHFDRPYNQFYSEDGDAEQYIGATESLYNDGVMTFMKTNEHLFYSTFQPVDSYDKPIYYAFRTPGFTAIHYPIRLIFNKHQSLNIMIILQIILNALAKYLLCLLFYRFTNSKFVFLAGVILFSLSILSSFYNSLLMTESLCFSFLVFGFYAIKKGVDNRKIIWIVFSGLMFTEAIMLRPFVAPVLLPLVIYLFYSFSTRKSVKFIFAFITPFVVLNSIWVLRNYSRTNEFIPVAATAKWTEYTNLAFQENQQICRSLGKENGWWVNSSPAYYLEKSEDMRNPNAVYGDSFFYPEIDTCKMILAKELYLKSNDNLRYSIEERQEYELESFMILKELHQKYKDNNNLYWIISRIKGAYHILNQPPLKPFISLKYPINVFTVALESAINNFVFFVGLLACALSAFRYRRNGFVMSLAFLPIFIFVFFAFILQGYELREMVIPYSFLLIFGVEFIFQTIKTKKYYYLSAITLFLIVKVIYDVYLHVTW